MQRVGPAQAAPGPLIPFSPVGSSSPNLCREPRCALSTLTQPRPSQESRGTPGGANSKSGPGRKGIKGRKWRTMPNSWRASPGRAAQELCLLLSTNTQTPEHTEPALLINYSQQFPMKLEGRSLPRWEQSAEWIFPLSGAPQSPAQTLQPRGWGGRGLQADEQQRFGVGTGAAIPAPATSPGELHTF